MDHFDYMNTERGGERQQALRSVGSDRLALLSLKIEDFVEIMLDEVERSGFTNVEFLVHAQLFLRSITPSYQQEDFLLLLRVLNDVDPNVINSSFYFSLVSLRKICTDSSSISDAFRVLGMPSVPNDKQALTSLIMFSTHFIENIIQQIAIMRSDKDARNKPIIEYKLYISRCVHQSLSKTLAELVSANLIDQ